MESVLHENIDNLAEQVKCSSIVANNVIVYKKTADALLLDIKKAGISVEHDFFSKVEKFEKEIEKLKSDYNKSYVILKNKIKKLMSKYDKKLSDFSKISKSMEKNSNNSFHHLPEMLDVSV